MANAVDDRQTPLLRQPQPGNAKRAAMKGVSLRYEDLTQAQLAWIDIIHAVINQSRFDITIGDIGYVINNMIAKMVSSSREYLVSEAAAKIIQGQGIDTTQPVHVAKHLYGKKKPTILEHMIPNVVLRKILLDSNRSYDFVCHVALNAGFVTVMTRDDDARLTNAGLKRRMPDNWTGIGDNPLKRYSAAGVRISELRIVHCGPICR